MVDPSPDPKSPNKATQRRWVDGALRRSRSTSHPSWKRLFRRRNLLIWAAICAAFLILFLTPARPQAGKNLIQESLSKAEALSRQLRELSLGVTDPAVLDSAFRRALRPEPSGSQSEPWQSNNNLQIFVNKVSAVLSALSEAKPVVSCTWDKSLPVNTLAFQGKVLLAANMHNNEDLLPHFTLQLLQLLIALPRGSAFVSIYESDSKDTTGEHRCLSIHIHFSVANMFWCDDLDSHPLSAEPTANTELCCMAGTWLTVLRDLLVCLGVPHRVIISMSHALPNLQVMQVAVLTREHRLHVLTCAAFAWW